MDSNCPTVFYSHSFHAVEQCGKSCGKFPLIFHSFLNEINVLIYQDVLVLDFLACAVLGTQKLIEACKPHLEIISCYFGLKI